MSEKISGGCLCGAVRYELEGEPAFGGHCYCVDCRKSSGTGHCSHMGVSEQGLRVTGDVTFFDAPADSGNIVSCAFCPTCGSPVYSRSSGLPGMLFLRVSSLDNPNLFRPQMSVYISRAPAWDRPDPDLPAHEEMPEGAASPLPR